MPPGDRLSGAGMTCAERLCRSAGSLTTESKDNGAGLTGLAAPLAGAPSFLPVRRAKTVFTLVRDRVGHRFAKLDPLMALKPLKKLFLGGALAGALDLPREIV
jgi:hypothetical protein